jgi:hypothetical protein
MGAAVLFKVTSAVMLPVGIAHNEICSKRNAKGQNKSVSLQILPTNFFLRR